ncbi:MAG: 23S rRNA (pseudouridine(1915)-N(3))-methyltransferase RlmH [Ruminococcus sp.]|jgi:23S rRNA (pseudouridine1915-N3)-methyltransferase|nr:23S rRNA (pseudouridine(1915)-N(3))-methyltransferase RlmH [Ruminococcus sp.]
MKIKIITVGKLKPEFSPTLNEYVKRMGRFCKLEIVEIAESYLPENPSPDDIKKALSAEAVAIKKQITGTVILLAVDGKQLSSEDFADYIKNKSKLTFIIGSSFGLDDGIAADLRLSFGRFTYPHSLMRIILVEQIYRAFMINSGSPYHK